MLTFGLVGGIGSGKSTVSEMFCKRGAKKIDADQIGHQILLKPEVKAAALQRWGNNVFAADGELDRRQLAAVVFADSTELDYLQSLTHPLIEIEIERQFQEFKSIGIKIVLFDAPLLIEAHWDSRVDRIIFVDAPYSVRLSRVLERGWTPAELAAREAAQISLDEKRRRADWIINNSENFDETLDQVQKIWQNLYRQKNIVSKK